MSNGKVTISVVVDTETQEWLEARARAEDRSVSSLVRTIIAEYREREEAAHPVKEWPKVLPGNDY